jgi:hypothetical protein
MADDGAHVSHRLLWTYIGLTFIAIGTLVYAFWCPPVIKKYGDHQDYINGDGEAMTRNAISQMLNDLEEKGYLELRDGVMKSPREDGDADVMEAFFIDSNRSYPAARLAVTLLYYVGFFILGVLSLRILFHVTALLVS